MTLHNILEYKEAVELFKKIACNQKVHSEGQTTRRANDFAQYSLKSEFENTLIEPGGRNAEREGSGSRQSKLERILEIMCQRGGFISAIVTDDDGLPLASYHDYVSIEALTAFTSVLGRSLEKASQILQKDTAQTISVDLDFMDKIVLRRFAIQNLDFYLVIVCAQMIDERSEIELTIEQIKSVINY